MKTRVQRLAVGAVTMPINARLAVRLAKSENICSCSGLAFLVRDCHVPYRREAFAVETAPAAWPQTWFVFGTSSHQSERRRLSRHSPAGVQ